MFSMTNQIKRYLAIACITVFLVTATALTIVSKLYIGSLETIGSQSEQIDQLKKDLEVCNADKQLILDAKKLVEDSYEAVERKNRETDSKFSELEREFRKRKCGSVINATKDVSVSESDDVSDVIRLLREANCISNNSCDDPRALF